MNAEFLASSAARADIRRRVLWLGGVLSVLVHAVLLALGLVARVPEVPAHPASQAHVLHVRWLPAPGSQPVAMAAPAPARRGAQRVVAPSPSGGVTTAPVASPPSADTDSTTAPALPPVGVALAPAAFNGWGGQGWGHRAVAAATGDDAQALSARLQSQAQARLQAQSQLAQQAQAEAALRALAIQQMLAAAPQPACAGAVADPHGASCDDPPPH